MVIVDLLAEVEHAVRERVVEKAKGKPRLQVVSNVEGNMLVRGVGRPCTVPDRVDIGEAIALARAVHIARALPEPEIFFASFAPQIVMDPLVPPAEVIGLRRPVTCRRPPLVFDPKLP